jgi:tripartite-type tricarboxylate transporter receptor subunit TctC
MIRTLLASAASAVWLTAAAQTAPDYPARPIRLIVIHAAGSSSDTFARLIAKQLNYSQGPVVVDNRPGASGILAMETVAKAPPDGYTLILSNEAALGIAPSVQRNLPYDPTADFAPITRVAASCYVLIANPAVQAGSMAEFVRLAKSRPGSINFGSSGHGGQLAGELLKTMASIDIVHVPYKNAPQALADLLGGQVQVVFVGLPLALPHVKAGKARALGVTTTRRFAALAEVPAIAEAGLHGYSAEPWWAILAPAKTPRPIVSKLNADIVAALRTPQIRESFAQHGAEPIGDTPEQFADRIQTEISKWAKVVKDAGVRVE